MLLSQDTNPSWSNCIIYSICTVIHHLSQDMIFNYLGLWYLPLCQHNLSTQSQPTNREKSVLLTSIYSQGFRGAITHSLSSPNHPSFLLETFNFSQSELSVKADMVFWERFFGALNYSSTSLLDQVFRIKFLFFVIFLLSPNLSRNLLTGKSQTCNQSSLFCQI